MATDEAVQGVVREAFRECTVVTIAHRLNTVIDANKIVVMDAGQVAEFGPPVELLQNESGHLSAMVRGLGEQASQPCQGPKCQLWMRSQRLFEKALGTSSDRDQIE